MSSTVPKKDSLNFLYFDTKSPVAFTSPLALYREAKKRYPSLTFQQVKTWLQSKGTYTLYKPVRYNFPRNRVIVTGIDDQWQADLVDISSLARFNKGYKFLLTCIDVFSKFAWVVPLKNKPGETLVNGFQSILDLGRSPEKLQTDKGTEFLNRNFQSFLKKKHIHFFTTNSELKASVVERFNRTLKTRMWKYFTAKNTRVYIDILQDIVHAYNNSYHRSIGQAPSSVSLLNVGQVRRKLYGKSWTKPMRKFKFKLGDQVRIGKSRRTFKKGYLPSWTHDLCKSPGVPGGGMVTGQIDTCISKEVFDQLISTRTLHEVIDDTNIPFTSIKHDFNICRKSFIKLYARYFLSQRTKQIWLMSTIKPNNSLWKIGHNKPFQG